MKRNKDWEDEDEDIDPLTQFDPDGPTDNMWEVLCIMKESGKKYQVQWAGIDPETGEPWKPEWINKEDCTDDLIREWKIEKAKRAAMKKAKTTHRQQSVASSKASASMPPESSRGSHQGSVDDVSARFNPRGLKPIVEITRKRQRTPPSRTIAPMEISDAADSDSESVEVPRARKRRRVAASPQPAHVTAESSEAEQPPSSPVMTAVSPVRPRVEKSPAKLKAVIPSPQDLSNATVIPDSQQQFESSQPTGSSFLEPSQRPKARPAHVPIPLMSPSIFRDKLPSPLSPVEDFDTPERSSNQPKSQFARNGAVYRKQSESQITDFTSSQRSQPAKKVSSQGYRSTQGSFQDRDPSQDASMSKRNTVGDLPDAAYDLAADVNQVAEDYTQAQQPESPRRLAPTPHFEILPRQPSRQNSFSLKDPTDSPVSSTVERFNRDLRLMAKDATISTLETRLAMAKSDVERRDARLEEEVEAHARSKSALEAQINSLMAALKQFASLSPEGIEAILHPKPPIVPPVVQPLLTAETITAYVRSADDDALITQLREENAKLQDQTMQLRAEKSSSDAMVEQIRDVARRAEAAKSDLARQTRKFEIIAANAPQNAEKLYSSVLRAAQEEAENYKAQMELLSIQNSLTGDNIRKKAAKYDVLGGKYQRLREDHDQVFEELCRAEDARDTAILLLHRIRDTLAEVNQSSPDDETLAKLKPLVGGLEETINVVNMEENGDEEEDDDEDEDEDGDELEEAHSPMSTINEGQPTVEEYDEEIPRVEEGGPAIVVEEVMDISQQLFQARSIGSTQTQRSDENVFVCLWHPTEVSCPEYHPSRGALVTHIYHEHHDNL